MPSPLHHLPSELLSVLPRRNDLSPSHLEKEREGNIRSLIASKYLSRVCVFSTVIAIVK